MFAALLLLVVIVNAAVTGWLFAVVRAMRSDARGQGDDE